MFSSISYYFYFSNVYQAIRKQILIPAIQCTYHLTKYQPLRIYLLDIYAQHAGYIDPICCIYMASTLDIYPQRAREL